MKPKWLHSATFLLTSCLILLLVTKYLIVPVMVGTTAFWGLGDFKWGQFKIQHSSSAVGSHVFISSKMC